MRYQNIIYPETFVKLADSGIAKRIREANEKGDIFLIGHISNFDIPPMVKEMGEEGIFDHLSDEEKKAFQEKMNFLFQSPDEYFWKTNRFGKEVKEKAVIEDVLGMIGWWSSQVLKPEEVFDYRRFGFANLTDFTGSVAALISDEIRGNLREGYKWEFRTSEGKVFANEITGDLNADLRIHRTDITPYETFDPLGNQVSYRPKMDADSSGLFPYHSTEDLFLVAVLKWVEQCNIESLALENNAQDTIEWAKSLGQRGGATTEHFFPASDEFRTHMSFNYGVPLPLLDENDRSEQHSFYGMIGESDFLYGMYVDSENNLAFAYEPREGKLSPEKSIRTRFVPEEADHLVKGILYQAAHGLGRTSAAQLVSTLEYRFSPQYEEDLKRFSI